MTAKISDLHPQDYPAHRVKHEPTKATTAELVAVILGGDDQLEKADNILNVAGYHLRELLNASHSRLIEVNGVGETSVIRLKASLALAVRLTEEQPPEPKVIHSPDDVLQFVGDMPYLEHEELRVICLNTRNHVKRIVPLYKGTVSSSAVRVSEVFKDAVANNYPAIIIVHNHPSGDPSPSPEDVGITKTLVEAGKLLEIQVLDHIIIGEGKVVSMNRIGLGFDRILFEE